MYYAERERRRKNRKAAIKYKKHLKWMAENLNHYPSPSWPIGADGEYTDPDKAVYYKRNYIGKNKKSYVTYCKKHANRIVRRRGKLSLAYLANRANTVWDNVEMPVFQGGAYKTLYVLWWEIL